LEAARLALDYLNAFLTPAPLAAGIVLFILLKYRQAIGNLFQILANQSEFRRIHDSSVQINYLGEQFIRVKVLYHRMLEHNIITAEQFRAWTDFEAHFAMAYQNLVNLWKVATEATGRSVGEKARSETLALAKPLAEFEASAYRALGKTLTPPPKPKVEEASPPPTPLRP
jgi:hypothetical protein